MLNGMFAIGSAGYGEKVELRLKTHVGMPHVCLSGTRHMRYFSLGHCLERVCITVGTCFYLCKNQHSVASGYYVYFKMP